MDGFWFCLVGLLTFKTISHGVLLTRLNYSISFFSCPQNTSNGLCPVVLFITLNTSFFTLSRYLTLLSSRFRFFKMSGLIIILIKIILVVFYKPAHCGHIYQVMAHHIFTTKLLETFVSDGCSCV